MRCSRFLVPVTILLLLPTNVHPLSTPSPPVFAFDEQPLSQCACDFDDASSANVARQVSPGDSFERDKQSTERIYRGVRVDGGRVTILGLFELTDAAGRRPEGRSELQAANLAVQHVNQRRVLGNLTLGMITNDTKCDPGIGVDRYFHALYTRPWKRMPILLGSACSEVTESLAKVVPYWNMVQVSFGSTSPALSDREEYPLFFRTAAPDSSHNPARIAFVRRFKWHTLTALSQNEDEYSLAINDLVTELERANITCQATITFSESDYMDQLKLLKDLDTRIIIGSFSSKVAPKIFCEAYHLGMYGADYVWIIQDQGGGLDESEPWWKSYETQRRSSSSCSHNQLLDAVESLILVSSHYTAVDGNPTISGMVCSQTKQGRSRVLLASC